MTLLNSARHQIYVALCSLVDWEWNISLLRSLETFCQRLGLPGTWLLHLQPAENGKRHGGIIYILLNSIIVIGLCIMSSRVDLIYLLLKPYSKREDCNAFQ